MVLPELTGAVVLRVIAGVLLLVLIEVDHHLLEVVPAARTGAAGRAPVARPVGHHIGQVEDLLEAVLVTVAQVEVVVDPRAVRQNQVAEEVDNTNS